jgi:CubicO group peptidase (beta-lactamase class C family)
MENDELKSALDEVRERYGIPSYSAAVYENGEVRLFSAGARDIDSGAAPDGDTLYAIGSCTKSFVAGAMCSLADSGLVSLDEPVCSYLPEFAMYDSYVTEHLTIRDMLCHRCGLPRHELAWYSRLDVMTEEDLVRTLRWLRPNVPFRYKWQYNNQMFALAGVLIKRVAGKPWQQVVRENIFEPLGIRRAAFSPAEAQAMGNCASPYLPGRDGAPPRLTPHADIGAMSAAGCIYLAPREMIKWDVALMHGGKLGDVQVLSPERAREMISPQMLRGSEMDAEPLKAVVTNHAYGFGLMTEVFEGHRLVHHGGHIDGFMADQSFLPDDDMAFVALTNLGEVRGAQVMRYVAAEKLLGGNHDWSAPCFDAYAREAEAQKKNNADVWAARPKDAPCPVALEDICGKYSEPGYGEIEITAENDRLKVRVGTLVMTGTHYANQYFYLEEPRLMPGLIVEACTDIDARGKVVGFSAAFNLEDSEKIHFARL